MLPLTALAAPRPLFFPAANPRLTQANFDRIRPGMRREEVEAILGPPGDYRTGPPRLRSTPSPGRHPGQAQTELCWHGDGAEIRLWLQADGAVSVGQLVPLELKRVGRFDLVLWRWHHWSDSWR
jgi:hypothetical protein